MNIHLTIVNEAAPLYQKALDESAYNHRLTFTPKMSQWLVQSTFQQERGYKRWKSSRMQCFCLLRCQLSRRPCHPQLTKLCKSLTTTRLKHFSRTNFVNLNLMPRIQCLLWPASSFGKRPQEQNTPFLNPSQEKTSVFMCRFSK